MAKATPSAVVAHAASCCQSPAAVAVKPVTCPVPMGDLPDGCPFVQARDTTWLQTVAVPDVRPDFVALVDPFAIPLVSFIEANLSPVATLCTHGPPRSPVALHVQLLC